MLNYLTLSVFSFVFQACLSTKEQFRALMKEMNMDGKVLHVLHEVGFAFEGSLEGRPVNLIFVDPVSDLGLLPTASHKEVVKRGEEMGLKKCPLEMPFQMALTKTPIPNGRYQFAVDAVRPKSDEGTAYVLAIHAFDNSGQVLVDAYVYDSADQPKRGAQTSYIFMQE